MEWYRTTQKGWSRSLNTHSTKIPKGYSSCLLTKQCLLVLIDSKFYLVWFQQHHTIHSLNLSITLSGTELLLLLIYRWRIWGITRVTQLVRGGSSIPHRWGTSVKILNPWIQALLKDIMVKCSFEQGGCSVSLHRDAQEWMKPTFLQRPMDNCRQWEVEHSTPSDLTPYKHKHIAVEWNGICYAKFLGFNLLVSES